MATPTTPLYINDIPDFPVELFIDKVTSWPDNSFDYNLLFKVLDPEYPAKVQLFDGFFNISYLKFTEPLFYERFIQLLPSLSLRLFSFTCKKFYIDALYLRGIEVERLWDRQFLNHSEPRTQVAKNGRLHMEFVSTEQRMIPYLSLRSLYVSNLDDLGEDFVITRIYTRLVVDLYGSNLGFKEALRHFHPGVKFVDFKFYYKTTNADEKFKVEEFPGFLAKLNNVEKLRLTLYFTGEDNSLFKELRKMVEQWLKFRPVPIKTFYFIFQNKVSFAARTEIKAVYIGGKLMRVFWDEEARKNMLKALKNTIPNSQI
ncbi:hypothetical protein FO519_001724 [Halicephalobus sp. NKZ332]|nr:hypothetical protein FO519_001724 [Halicephalobus sp. NKZ332]